jgi:hypothetical protein
VGGSKTVDVSFSRRLNDRDSKFRTHICLPTDFRVDRKERAPSTFSSRQSVFCYGSQNESSTY